MRQRHEIPADNWQAIVGVATTLAINIHNYRAIACRDKLAFRWLLARAGRQAGRSWLTAGPKLALCIHNGNFLPYMYAHIRAAGNEHAGQT